MAQLYRLISQDRFYFLFVILEKNILNTNYPIFLTKMSTRTKKAKKDGQSITVNTQSNPLKRANKLSIQTTRIQQPLINPNRLHTELYKPQTNIPFQDQWDEIFNRRQNFLNAMFNRRKTALETISKKNRDIYIRIMNQQSHYPLNKVMKENVKGEKDQLSIQNLTAQSRLLLTLSKHTSKNSTILTNSNKIQPLQQKSFNVKSVELDGGKPEKRNKFQRHLAPILQNNDTFPPTEELKVIESRFLRDQISVSSQSRATSHFRTRNKSVGRGKISDVFVNF